MESAFGWTQIARSDVAKATELLKDGERGVRDEIGFLTLHQGFADRFFPGTSVLQTRLRYALFVPWQIEELRQRTRAGSLTAEQRLKRAERTLVLRLREAGNGVIGLGSVNFEPAQPPSTIYWTALRLWGILNSPAQGVWPGRSELLARVDNAGWSDDRAEGATPLGESTFFALPPRPSDWESDAPLNFRLAHGERRYLLERIESAKRIAPGSKNEESLFARLAKSRKWPSSWKDAGFASPLLKESADETDREALRMAIAASSLAHVGRAAYSALVESLAAKDGRKTNARFSSELTEIVAENRRSALSCDLAAVEDFVGKLETRFRLALSETLDWLKTPSADVTALWMSYCESEKWRKGQRARLPKNAHAESLRATWVASKVPKADSLNYRWHRVGALLDDLHGLHG